MSDAAFAVALTLREQAAKYLELQRAIIAAGHRLDDVMRLTVGKVHELMPKAGGAVVDVLDGEFLECRARYGETVPPIGFRMPMDGSFSGLCIEARQAMLCVDTVLEVRINREACDMVGVRSMVVVPIIVHGIPRGVLKLLSSQPCAFGVDELLMAELLAAPIIIGFSARTAREQAAEKLLLEQRFRATFEHAAVGIAHVDSEGRFLMVNQKFCNITGYAAEDLIGHTARHITHPDDIDEGDDQFAALLSGDIESFTVEKRYVRPSGTLAWTRLTASAVRNDAGEVDFCVSIIEDIGKQKQAQHEVLVDALTSLPNRRWLTQNLPHMLAGNLDRTRGLGIAFIDLDDFKTVNDRFGHDVGDRCLIGVADVLQAQVGASGVVVHLSGDEFVVILEDVGPHVLEELGPRLCGAIARLADQNGWPIKASIGSVLIQGEHRTGASDVLRLADEMMYRAKRAGGGKQIIATLGDGTGDVTLR